MRKYETFFIVDSDLPDETNSVIDNKIRSIVTSNGGEVIAYTPWGKRKLSYPIRKRTRGSYILMEYAGGANLVAELERNLRIDERILKFITVKLEDRYDREKEEERRAAAIRLKEEEEARKAALAQEEEESEIPEEFAGGGEELPEPQAQEQEKEED